MYQYNPKLHVKIWLSNNPNVFMNLENQVRLVEMREKNPTDIIHLIYDSELLTHGSKQALSEFCKEHHITHVDAHTIQKKLKSEVESKLYRFYKDEISNLKTGGNLAVASDILRWLSPIFKYGTYTDFDFPVDTSHLPATITVKVPLLLNIGSLKMGKQEFILANNDFVAVVDPVAARKEIKQIQTGILARLTQYDADFVERINTELNPSSFINRHLLKFMKNRSEFIYIVKSKKINPPESSRSSLEIRQYIQEVMTDKNKFLAFNRLFPNETNKEIIKRLRKTLQEQMNFIKYLFYSKEYSSIKRILEFKEDKFLIYLMKKERELYLKSIVICTTGPIQISNALFKGYVVNSDVFNKEVEPISFNHYGLQKAFRSQNSIPLHENVLGMLKFLGVDDGELNDSSWLDSGKKLQASRTKQLAARQKELAANLPISLSIIKNNVEAYLQKIAKPSQQNFVKERKKPEIKTLQLILSCFDQQKNEFNITQFKQILFSMDQYKKGVYTQKLITNLENLSHDAIIFSLAKDKKIKLAQPSIQLNRATRRAQDHNHDNIYQT